jgi:biopolymer transport protein ExbD
MLRFALVALSLLGCARNESKVCPDPVTAETTAKPGVAPMRTIEFPIPKASAFGNAEAFVSIQLDAVGGTFVNGLAITDDKEIFDAGKKALGTNAAVKAIIAADSRVTYGRLIAVIDRLRMAGITNIAFGVPAP